MCELVMSKYWSDVGTRYRIAGSHFRDVDVRGTASICTYVYKYEKAVKSTSAGPIN